MKGLFFSLFFLLACATQAQELIPQNYKLETKEDFQHYETNVKACIQWLLTTPRSKNAIERTAIEAFAVKWIRETPYVTVVIEPYAMRLAKKNPDLLLTFMFAYTAYQLQNPADKMLLNPNIAGVESLIRDYKINQESFKKDEKIEEILELQKKGEINAWVKNQLIQQELQH